MKTSEDDFRQRYAELNDDGLLSIHREELVEVARRCYDDELASRALDDKSHTAAEPHAERYLLNIAAAVIAVKRAVSSRQWLPKMVTQARAALCASIVLALTRADWIAGQVVMLNHLADFRMVYVVQLFANVLFLLPLPVLLFLLYRHRMALALTPGLRLVALATAFVVGVVFTVPPLYGAATALVRDLSNIHWFGTTSVAPAIWTWLISYSARNECWGFVLQLPQITLAIFLVTLVRNEPNHSERTARGHRLLRRVAAVATATAAVAVVLNIAGQVRALQDFSARQEQIQWWGGPTKLQFVIRNAGLGSMEVCRLLIPLIVYRSLSTSAKESTGTSFSKAGDEGD